MTPSAITPKMIRREISFSMVDPELDQVIETVQYAGKDLDGVDIWLIYGVTYRLHGTSRFISNGVSEILNAIKRIMKGA